MSPFRKGSIGIPARPLQYYSNGAGGNPIFVYIFVSPPYIDGVSIKYLERYVKSLTLSFRVGVKAKKQNLGVLTPFWNVLNNIDTTSDPGADGEIGRAHV